MKGLNLIRGGCGVVAGLLLVASAQAAAVLSPGIPVIGGRSDGTNFIQAAAGTSPTDPNVYTDNLFPAAESPANLVDGKTNKYLNFAELNTGAILTPTAASVATSLSLWTANDGVERDPASYQLYGTNSAITGSGPFPLSLFTLISSGSLALPAARNNTAVFQGGTDQTVTFANSTSYTSYLILFPTVKNEPAANSMQIGEIQINNVPEPASLSVLALGALGLLRRRR